MKINIIAIGKIKEKFISDAISEYTKRLSKYAEIALVELPECNSAKSVAEQQEFESSALLKKAKGFVILTEVDAREMTSPEFASYLNKKTVDGVSEFSILIGGSHGHSAELKKSADLQLSFSKMTFPHQLFRVLVLEQVYRAMTILANTPYHK